MSSDRTPQPFDRLTAALGHVTRLIACHPLAVDLLIILGTAGLSLLELATQHRLYAMPLIFCGALCVPLLARRSNPRLCFAVVALVAFLQWLISVPQVADAAILIALYSVALEGGPAEVVLAAATVEAGAVMAAVRWSPSEPLKIWVGLSGLAVAAGVLGVTVRQRRALLISLQEKAARLEVERDQEGRLAAAAERARIAREMHDIVAHNLSVMIALADGATYAMGSSPEQALRATRRVSATGRQALLEMRRLLGLLRDESAEQPLQPQPSLGRLDELVTQMRAAGIPVSMELAGDPHQLPDGVQLTVFRVAQEALTNTLKHAARPTAAHLALRCRTGTVELEVTDTGHDVAGDVDENATPENATPTPGGRGLRGMRERAAAYGGRLEVGPRPGGGWRVLLRLKPDVETAAR